VALVAALLSFFVGVGPILFRRNAIFLIVGVAMALDFWVLGQAFGQVFTGMATDPDTGPLLVLLALAVYRAGVPAGAAAETRLPEPASSAFPTRAGSLVS
jgi:NADH:ubiquinone oxidoreductase subunit K